MQFVDYDAECKVLSAMMHDDKACLEVVERLHDKDFTDPFTRNLFTLMSGLYIRGIKPTTAEIIKEGLTLGFISKLQDKETLQRIAKSYIDEENIHYWIDKVLRARKGREIQSLLRRYSALLQEQGKLDINQLVSDCSGDLFSLAMDADTEKIDTPEEIAELGISLVNKRVEQYRRMQEECKALGHVPMEGLPTGIKTLDNKTLGMKSGDLVILGAQTGHGKTAFALSVAQASCVEEKNNILYVNTEMSRNQIAYRWGAILSGIELHRIRAGNLSNEEKAQVIESYDSLRRSGFYPASIPNLTPAKLDVLARKAKMQRDIKLLILDYVGRMEKIHPDLQEWQVLEQIIKSMKILAQNLEIACLILVQLNPDGSLQGAKRMENECDLMLKLIPVEPNDVQKLEEILKMRLEPGTNYRIYVNKARDAESGVTIPLVFDKARQRIRQAEELKDGWESYGKPIEATV